MSEVPKQKQQPIPLRLEAPLKSKSATLPTRLDDGGSGNAVKGQDERQRRAPLTAFPAPMPSCAFLHLTQAVVVIHGMTIFFIVLSIRFKLYYYLNIFVIDSLLKISYISAAPQGDV